MGAGGVLASRILNHRSYFLSIIRWAIMTTTALPLTGCLLVVETRSSAECTKEQCKAESSLKRSGEGKEQQQQLFP